MSDAFADVREAAATDETVTVESDKELRERAARIDTDPHHDEPILRYLLRDCWLSLSDAAERLSSVCDDDYTKDQVRYGKNKHDIRMPSTGPFSDVFCGGDGGTEPAHPPRFLLDRSDDTPVHPLDTDAYVSVDTVEGEGGSDRRTVKSSTTLHSPPAPTAETDATTPETPDSPQKSRTGVLKPLADHRPSDYRLNKGSHDELVVAPPSAVDGDGFPAEYTACGCGSCEERHFLDGDGGAIDCPRPLPVTVGGARRIYQKTVGKNWAERKRGNHVVRALKKYKRIMKADSTILRRTSGPTGTTFTTGTTAACSPTLVSLRVSPTDDEGRLVTPYRLVQDVHAAFAEARDELPDDLNIYGYCWTLTGTDYWGTPHVHLYIWVFDPDDELTAERFRPVVMEFCEVSTFAEWKAHVESGYADPRLAPLREGAVRVETDPLLADPEVVEKRSLERDDLPTRVKDGDRQTRGAIYVGKQLPHLALRGRENPAHAEFAAACLLALDGKNACHGDRGFYMQAGLREYLN